MCPMKGFRFRKGLAYAGVSMELEILPDWMFNTLLVPISEEFRRLAGRATNSPPVDADGEWGRGDLIEQREDRDARH
jgi:hypothetical protein